MNRKLYLSSIICGTVMIFSGISLVFAENDKHFKGHAEENTYLLSLDSTNSYSSGNEHTIKTARNADVSFTYINCVEEEGSHALIHDGGTIGNREIIHSMNAFYAEFTGPLQIRISYNQVAWSEYQDIESGYEYSLGANPYYIQMRANGGDVSLSEFDIGFSCEINESAEPQDIYAYQKVTATSQITTGDYIIVYEYASEGETYAVIFDGSLASPDVNSNYIMAYIEDGLVYSTDEIEAAAVTINPSNKSIRLKSGKYIGTASNTNVLSVSNTAYSHSALAINSDGSFQATCNKAILRFSLTSTATRFRYFKSTTASTQQKVCLYQKVYVGREVPFVEIAAVENNIDSFVTYKSYNQVSDLLVAIFDANEEGYLLDDTYYSLFLYDPNGNYVSPSKKFEVTGTYTAVVAFGNFAPVVYTFEVREGTPILNDTWTIMLYICGSDLESGGGLASGDIEEILSVNNQPDDVNIIIETGGSNSWDKYGIAADKLERYHVSNKQLIKDQSLNYASMSIGSTLQSFVEYGINNYPSDNMGLILWNHGGAMEGVCFDEVLSDNEYEGLTTYEVDQALSNAFRNTGYEDKFEFIGYDACLMQIQEAALFNAQYANYMIASQESETGYGWDYDTWVDDLYANKSTETILKACVDGFIAENGGSSASNDQTLSVLDLSYMDEYYVAWEAMASKLTTIITTTTAWNTFKTVVNMSMKFGYDNKATAYNGGYRFDIFDVGTFISAMRSSSSYTSLSSQLNDLEVALSNLVLYKKNGGGAANASGLCFFCPLGGYQERVCATAEYNGFTTWCSLINTYGKFYS